MRLPFALAAAVAPPLALAVLGSSHPTALTPETATWWRDLHVIGLALFPLLALGPWAVVRGRSRVVEAAVVVLGFAYAVFYTALDVLAGIGGGELTIRVGPGPWVSSLFGVADRLVVPGVYAYLGATLLAAVTATLAAPGAWRVLAAAGGVVALIGASWFLSSHIYPPFGVVTMVALALGHGAAALAVHVRPRATDVPVLAARHAAPSA